MSQVSILELPSDCFFEIFKYIKENCEREKPNAPDEIKYKDFINFAACCKPCAALLCDWNITLYISLQKYLTFRIDNIHIDFEEVYTRLKNASAKYKETYWSSLSQAIRDAPATYVTLFYAPESFHSDHMEAFRTVIDQLQNKTNLEELHIDVRGYTLEGLGALRSLEELRLNVRMDIDDLIEMCRLNKNLRILEYMNNETGGKRLAAIVPHCEHLKHLAFAMRPDCDASEYRPLAKIPRLQYLQIKGVHEKGTLQPLLEGFACKDLYTLSIVDATLDHNETQAMAQIETLTQVECGFDDPQSIGLLSQLTELKQLKILSKHDFGALSEPVWWILVESKGKTSIELENCSLSYSQSGALHLYTTENNANASDYSPLLTPVLNGFRNVPTLTDLSLENITAEEFAAVSEIASLKRLECGFAETQNAELLAQLPVLEELTIKSVPSSPGSLQGLLAALASRESQTLQKLCLKRKIDAVEANELSRLTSLRTLACQFADPLDIQLLSQLPELKKLNLNAMDRLDQILPLVLIVIKSCKKLADIHIQCKPNHSGHVDMKSSEILVEMLEAFQDKFNIRFNDSFFGISGNREKNKLFVNMLLFRQNKLAIESLARVQSVNHMEIHFHVVGEPRALFAALAMRTNSNLQSLCTPFCPLDFSETTELAKITSLTKFKGPISDIRSLQHLLHLSNFEVWNELELNGQVRRNITFDKSTGKLNIINKTANELQDDIGLNPLASLQNLRHVTISGVYKEGFMCDFLGQLATCQGKTLQTLEIFPKKELNYAELREVIKLKSLRKLACGLSHVKDVEIEQLEQLPHLAVLIVVSHRTGSLGSLLRTLAARKCPTLTHLTVEGESLTPQEVTDVSAISSLERLSCGFCSTEGLDVLSQRSCIEELVMKTRKGEASLVDLLTAVAASGESKIQNLTIDGPAVGQELATVLSLVLRIPRLKSLKLRIKDTQGIERLSEFLHLEELTISYTRKKDFGY
ncbi:uncharacterized protein LOC111082218 [Drosophila obscura]|uniref:uncharacterized protein LOC111082218 n=1 Tax=Drosophila obscura TaxID=7282 RepID=UPI001BB14246|nr:uncharacterized protein LOC111082218 [Drosophila obscura]